MKAQEVSLPDLKNTKSLSTQQVKEQEGLQIMAEIRAGDQVFLLDERGQSYSSRSFAQRLQEKMNRGPKRLVFVIGGPYGFSDAVYQRFPERLSLSKMTFSHQLARVLLNEQLYRAYSILNNAPYHND